MDIQKFDSKLNEIQNVKRRFFALRNGVVADMLRRHGSPYRLIFGLNLPQLREIAEAFGYNENLALSLWENASTRESRLLAPMLLEPSHTEIQTIKAMISTLTDANEESDYLCHQLLRKTPFLTDLIEHYKDSQDPKQRYIALRLAFSLLPEGAEDAMCIAQNEILRACSKTQNVALQLRREVEDLLGFQN